MAIPLTAHGKREIVLASLLAAAGCAIALAAGYPLVIAALAPVWLFVLAFFRDPARRVPDDPNAVLAPADGRVTEISEVDDDPRIGGPAWRIGIFLSIFDVHINRAPCCGTVADLSYSAGRYLDARNPDSGRLNESNTVVLADAGPWKSTIVVKQIAGLIARRIICTCGVGDALAPGQRFGMIKFGSRTELYLPARADVEIRVKVGDPVRAGLTTIACRADRPPTQEASDDHAS